MNQRKALIVIATILGTVGLVGIGWVFLGNLQPNTKTLRNHEIEVDLSTLAPGKVMTIDWERQKVFVLRRSDEQVKWLKNYTPPKLKFLKDELFSSRLNNPFRSFQEKYFVFFLYPANHGKKFYISETHTVVYRCNDIIFFPR